MFLHGYLLLGLGLAVVPVLLHLLLKQRPRRVVFPAFRFLKQRQQTNQRRMRLQNLLLLLLRVLVLCVLILAFARPRLFADRAGTAMDRPVAAVLLFDTSPSMDYAFAGTTRLDEARRRARELLDEMESTSRVAVLDSGDPVPEPLLPVGEARARLKALATRPGAGSLNRAVERALDLLARNREQKAGTTDDAPPHLLVIFSDRARACWDQRGVQPKVPEGVSVLFVDVGAERPQNLGIEKVELVPPAVAPGASYQVRVHVRGTAGGHENQVSCQLDGEPQPEVRLVRLEKDHATAVIAFDRAAPAEKSGRDTFHPMTLRLGTRDALPFDDVRHATLVVRGVRRMLTLVQDDPAPARIWAAAHQALRAFDNEVLPFAKADALPLSNYTVVVLCQPVSVPAAWWKKLDDYARQGGSVAVIPPGDELTKGFDNELLPAPLGELASTPAERPLAWRDFSGSHALLAPFVAWARGVDPDFLRPDHRPFVRRYWRLGPLRPDALAVTAYENGSPALAERRVGPRGKVLLFTSPLDVRWFDEQKTMQWNNYWQDSSFGLVLIDRTSRYLAGEQAAPDIAFPCGVEVSVRVPSPLAPPYTVTGPGLRDAEQKLKAPTAAGEITVPQARQPGNFTVLDEKRQAVAGFSLDVPSGESDLTRVPDEEVRQLFGDRALVKAGQSATLREALSASHSPPWELLPYLMLAVLALMTAEGLFANRFYRTAPEPEAKEAKAA